MTAGMLKALRRLGVGALCTVLIWLFVCVNLFCFPAPESLSGADAVVVLGGASAERLPPALSVRDRLRGRPVLVLSVTGTRANAQADALCRDALPGPGQATAVSPSLECFRSSPLNTRGEAQALRALVKAQGWKRIVVVTSGYHVARAGELMAQCVPAGIQMAATSPELTPWQWLRRFVVETGGLLDVALRRECG